MSDIVPNTPGGYVIFCDDVRQETGNKVSYMGVYSGDMTFGEPFPVVLPKLCCAIIYRERPNESNEPLTLTVTDPNSDEEEALIEVELPHEQFRAAQLTSEMDDPLLVMTANLSLGPISINKAGAFRVYVTRGDQKVRLARLQVRHAPLKEGSTNKVVLPKSAERRLRQ